MLIGSEVIPSTDFFTVLGISCSFKSRKISNPLSAAAERGFDIFLDLKLHDIPNTVKKSVEGITSLPISMLTIHISGGRDMMKATMDAVSGKEIKIFGVTALTSLLMLLLQIS